MRKKELFGKEYEILYDTVNDHDAYRFLRISLEVERGTTSRCTVVLNGNAIGFVVAIISEKPDVPVEYRGHRYMKASPTIPDPADDATLAVAIGKDRPPFRTLGKCVAAIISDFV